jgi:hypothetical protein
VLSDGKKRSIYDRYGEFGLQMMGTPIEILFDPDYTLLVCRCFFVTSLLTGLLIIFCVLLSVRVDGKSNWPWSVVFIPIWLLDAILFFWLVPLASRPSLTSSDVNDDNEEEDQQQQRPESGSYHSAQHSNGGSGGDRRESRQARRKRAARQRGIFVSIYLLLCFTFQLLIVLREDEQIHWSAGAVFVPYWILEAVNGFSNILTSIVKIRSIPAVRLTTNAPMSSQRRRLLEARIVADAFWWWCIRVSLAILIVLKIDGALTASWATVFIPLYLAGVRYILLFTLASLRLRRIDHADSRAQGVSFFITMCVLFLLASTLVYAFIGMLVEKLQDPSSHGMAVVLVPVFIVLSMLFCCTCCCASCLFCAQNLPVDRLPDEALQRVPVPVNRRITYQSFHTTLPSLNN